MLHLVIILQHSAISRESEGSRAITSWFNRRLAVEGDDKFAGLASSIEVEQRINWSMEFYNLLLNEQNDLILAAGALLCIPSTPPDFFTFDKSLKYAMDFVMEKVWRLIGFLSDESTF